MLTRLKIPYPNTAAVANWAKYLDLTIRLASLVWLARISSPLLGRLILMRAAALLGIALMCLNETLRVICIYIALTRGWQHYQWVFTLVDRLPIALIWCFYGVVAAIIARQLQHKNLALPTATVVVVSAVTATAAFGMFVIQPVLEKLAIASERTLHLPDPVQVYFEPYPLTVDWVIYGTFIEATFAAFVLVGLVLPNLRGALAYRICKCAMLLLLVRGRMTSMFLFSFWVPESRGLAFLSESQFFLETLLLGGSWSVVWTIVLRSRVIPES